MERVKNNSFRRKLNGVKLFRKDVNKIIEDYQNDGCEVSIMDLDYKYETLDDFVKNNGTRVKHLELSIKYDESIFGTDITFKGPYVNIRAQKKVHLANEVLEYLKPKSTILYYILHPWLWFTIVAVSFAILPPEDFLSIVVEKSFDLKFYLFIGSIFALFISLIHHYYILGTNLEMQHNTGFARYRSEIIVGVITAVVVFVLTKLVGQII